MATPADVLLIDEALMLPVASSCVGQAKGPGFDHRSHNEPRSLRHRLKGAKIPAYGQNNYRTLGASDVRRVAASQLPFFMKNRLIVFERAAAANARLSNRARQ